LPQPGFFHQLSSVQSKAAIANAQLVVDSRVLSVLYREW
jgi:hypothetical protein